MGLLATARAAVHGTELTLAQPEREKGKRKAKKRKAETARGEVLLLLSERHFMRTDSGRSSLLPLLDYAFCKRKIRKRKSSNSTHQTSCHTGNKKSTESSGDVPESIFATTLKITKK